MSATPTATFTTVEPADASDPALREQLLATWVRVTDAGGAVGFVPPADPELIAPTLDAALVRVAEGRDRLGVMRRDDDGAAVGMGILAASSSALRVHWRTILRLMVDPALQGTGAGGRLLTGLHEIARDELNLEFLVLSVRGATGTENFYAHHGYVEYGRNPHAIRVAPDDERDEILMRREL